MPITHDERREHLEKFGLTSLDTMHTADYRKALEEEAFFWDDPHGFVMHTLSGERIVTNTEQLDALLEHLEGYRVLLSEPPGWMSEK
ncbi:MULTISPECIES: hypothetical protein [Phytobacter]|uniref:Uncharacterized protein n=1 Tax=Phytobacter diazotrophicus TaxID=395631 RepID=A0ABM7W0D6_9ENTR|nr:MULTISPECIES: hypothetical protein [Phytobacter]BBE79622.1 hypothetical protein MRY16398_46780 [Phytobacter sp. MRY16-398]BDD53000.1 hypothetical protein PDTA9734_44870 [Phytobacter diazotrophicus]BEG83928.1 hypothetical protein PDTA9730_43840 [Phytobacter diazotrophicus]BEG89826.1 hypothetical protein PDTA9759_44820 [Phytobacter diazotrophicus]BEG95590.1 hypothetical protein PDTA9832_44490 [Phytobacter diazotrophicus]